MCCTSQFFETAGACQHFFKNFSAALLSGRTLLNKLELSLANLHFETNEFDQRITAGRYGWIFKG